MLGHFPWFGQRSCFSCVCVCVFRHDCRMVFFLLHHGHTPCLVLAFCEIVYIQQESLLALLMKTHQLQDAFWLLRFILIMGGTKVSPNHP